MRATVPPPPDVTWLPRTGHSFGENLSRYLLSLAPFSWLAPEKVTSHMQIAFRASRHNGGNQSGGFGARLKTVGSSNQVWF